MVIAIAHRIDSRRKVSGTSGRRSFRISRERVGRLLRGVSILASLGLGYFIDRAWFLLLVGIAFNMVKSSITDRCFMIPILTRLGFPGERDLGRMEARAGRDERRGGVS